MSIEDAISAITRAKERAEEAAATIAQVRMETDSAIAAALDAVQMTHVALGQANVPTVLAAAASFNEAESKFHAVNDLLDDAEAALMSGGASVTEFLGTLGY